jgi:oligoendopeptidase F
MMNRSEVTKENRWKVEAIFNDLEDWKKALNSLLKDNKLNLTNLLQYKGKLHEGPEVLKKSLDANFNLERQLTKLYTYAHLRHDEDIADTENKGAFIQMMGVMNDYGVGMSWFEPELLSLSEEKMKEYLNSPALKDFRFHLEKIFRMKPHTLSKEEERLIALSGNALSTSYKTFSALNDADLKFGEAIDSNNKVYPITHGNYQVLLRSPDRTLRQNAFETYHHVFAQYQNTLAELLRGAVERNIFNARARRFPSALDAALYPNKIDPKVYRQLISTVKQNLKPLYRYFDLRKKILGLDDIHLFDMMVPLTPSLDMKVEYPDAEKLLIDAFKPLGSDYTSAIEKGLKSDRWVDRYENKNKRSGAYSSGCYDTDPYILMNYKNLMRDVFTLAHEAGHSMHSLLTRKTQPYHYGDYPIFLAEVASTFNEELLNHHLLNTLKSDQEKIFLITQKLDDIRGTLFRQTMFAEFELKIHEMAEQNIPLTPQALKTTYYELAKEYFGPGVVVDDIIAIEWSRIPHFYYNFYVFQYATGVSAALALANKVLKGGANDQEAYLNFLRSGSSRYPIETLEQAGVRMDSPEPIMGAINYFDDLVTKLSTLIK